MIIDYTYFTDEYLIAGTEKTDIQKRITNFITKYEPDFLRKSLGQSFYTLFNTGIGQQPIATRWANLLNGCTYQLQDQQRSFYWPGFKNTNNIGQSAIAMYVYYMWRANEASTTTIVGETSAKTENSYRANPDRKMVKAWNEMVNLVRGNPSLDDSQEPGYLWHYLLYGWDVANNVQIFPEFNISYVAISDLQTKTILGL